MSFQTGKVHPIKVGTDKEQSYINNRQYRENEENDLDVRLGYFALRGDDLPVDVVIEGRVGDIL